MKKFKTLLLALVALVSVFACKTEYEIVMASNDLDLMYDMAFDLFNQGKYDKAARLFESMSMISTGTSKEDTVAYYWGLSNYRFRDYYTAETNFESFIQSFPRSPFISDALFMRIDCLYRSTYDYELDQTPTNTAIAAIQDYLRTYPDNPNKDVCEFMLDDLNERLDKKALEAAKLYYKMEDYLAAHVSFRNILKDDADNRYREDILYYTAMSSFKYAENSVKAKQKERYMVYVDDYYNFIGEYPESSHVKELENLYKRSQKFLGKSQ